MDDAEQIYTELDNVLQFWHGIIKEIEAFLIAKINDRKTMSKILNKYTTALEFADRFLYVLSGTSSGVFLSLFIWYCSWWTYWGN